MLNPFGEAHGDGPEYFHRDKIFKKMTSYKVISKNRSKTITAGVFFCFFFYLVFILRSVKMKLSPITFLIMKYNMLMYSVVAKWQSGRLQIKGSLA